MKISKNKQFYSYLYKIGWLETMEFAFCNDIIMDYRDDNIAIYYKEYDQAIVWRGFVK